MPWTLRMTLIAFAFAILPYIFIGLRMNNALGTLFPARKKQIKLSIYILFGFLNLLPVVVAGFYLTGNGDAFTHQNEINLTDVLFTFPFWAGFLAIFELFFYFLAIEIGQKLLKIFNRIKWLEWQKGLAWLKLILFAGFFVFVFWRIYFDTYTIRIDRHQVQIPGLPEEFNGLNLALVGDIQVDRFTQQKKIDQFYNRLDQIDPDMLFFAGDLVTRGTEFIDQGVKTMCATKASLARVACIGDHDVWADAGRISQGLAGCGWDFLNDQHKLIDFKGKKVLVTGITYVYSRRIPYENLEALLAAAPEADLKILLVHQPARIVIEAAVRHGYQIMLAGHTHGGQIVFRPFGFTLTPTMVENNYYTGFQQIGQMALFVTNGIGLTMMPLRYRAPAEIQQIVLTGQIE